MADFPGCTRGSIPAASQAAGERAIDWRSPGVAHSESRGFISESRGVSPGFIPAAIQAAGERAFRWRISRVAPGAPFPRPLRPQESGRSIGVVPGLRTRIHGVSSPNPGDSPRAPFPRPLRPPSVRGGFGLPGILPGLHSSGHSGRRRAGVSVADFPGCTRGSIPAASQAAGERAIEWRSPGVAHLDSRGFISESRGFSPGLHSRGLSGRRRCAAVSGSRGFSPGFIPAAFQAAGERAIDWRSPGVAHRIHGVSSLNPGDSPRASFPRPFRPQESGRFGGGFPGLHLGFPGILPGLHSRGLSGRRRAGVSVADFPGCTSNSRGFSPGFIPAAFQM